MPDTTTRLARAIVRRYPRAWRDRYEVELLGLIEDVGVGWRDVVDLARGCVTERARAFVEPETHPNRAWMLAGAARWLPALGIYAVLMGVAGLLRRTVAPPPFSVQVAAFIVLVAVMLVAVIAWVRLLRAPEVPVDRVPARWAVTTWLAVFCLSLVVIAWSDSGPPSRLGWLSPVAHAFIYAYWVRLALDLYWPAGRQRSRRLMHIAALCERLGWARMELARCESLGRESDDLARAREEVARLEHLLVEALADLRRPPTRA